MATTPRLVGAFALAAALLVPLPARAAAHTVVSAGYLYAPPELTIARGDTVDLANVDPVPHNIVSDEARNGRLLFASPLITAGQTAAVKGVEKLAPGTYGYHCSIHPNMHGVLRVGTPTAAPGYVAVPVGQAATPTSITVFGDSLYVSSYASGTVSKMLLLPGGGLGPAALYASTFSNPLGIAFGPDGTLFVADSHAAGTATVGRVVAVPPGGGGLRTTVVDGLPNGRHNTNGLAVHRGRLYITNGNSTDDGVAGGDPEQPLSGTLLSVPLDARNVAPKAGRTLLVEGRGMRNLYDVAFRPDTNEAWVPTNGPDALDPWGEDTLNVFDVRAGTADFGFPQCVWRRGANGKPEWTQNRAIDKRCTGRERAPAALFGLHVSANGIAFAPKTGGWTGDAYVALFGNNPGEQTAGHKIVRVPVVNGRAQDPVEVLPAASPLDVTFGPAGLYVADFASGVITLVLPVG